MESRKKEEDKGRLGLRIDWATYDASLFACKNWHYSHSIPAGKLVKIGVWESGVFKGVVIFARGATPNIASPYGLKQSDVCELARVALTRHDAPVAQIVSIAIKMLRKVCPHLKLIVSYADIDQGHEGIIYKAGNWIYEGLVNENALGAFIVHGRKMHPRSIGSRYGTGAQSFDFVKKLDPNAKKFITKGKHKYLYVLDASIRDAIMKKAKIAMPDD